MRDRSAGLVILCTFLMITGLALPSRTSGQGKEGRSQPTPLETKASEKPLRGPRPTMKREKKTGYCCRNGEIKALGKTACSDAGGTFFPTREKAESRCKGWCCADFEVTQSSLKQCSVLGGRYAATRQEATRICERTKGFCNAQGKTLRLSRIECRNRKGAFFAERNQARNALLEQERRPTMVEPLRRVPAAAPGSKAALPANGKIKTFLRAFEESDSKAAIEAALARADLSDRESRQLEALLSRRPYVEKLDEMGVKLSAGEIRPFSRKERSGSRATEPRTLPTPVRQGMATDTMLAIAKEHMPPRIVEVSNERWVPTEYYQLIGQNFDDIQPSEWWSAVSIHLIDGTKIDCRVVDTFDNHRLGEKHGLTLIKFLVPSGAFDGDCADARLEVAMSTGTAAHIGEVCPFQSSLSSVCDQDGDGVDSEGACGGTDCDDSDRDRFPGNDEICDRWGHDEDCDPSTFASRHDDGDGDHYFGNHCFNYRDDHSRSSGGDCDDSRADISPAQVEVCNGMDDNCDGEVDEGLQIRAYQDQDGDSFGNPEVSRLMCYNDLTPEWVINDTDCDDGDPTRNPITGCP